MNIKIIKKVILLSTAFIFIFALNASALSSSWDLNTPADYTLSDSMRSELNGIAARLSDKFESQIDDEISNYQIYSTSSLLNNGNIFISWYSSDTNHSTNAVGQDNDNDSYHIAAKIVDEDGFVVVPEFQVNDEIEGAQSDFDVAPLTNGNIAVVWRSNDINHSTNAVGQTNDNDSSHMAAKIFDQNGVVVVPEFQVNDEVESHQYYPDILSLSNGNILISWTSYDTNHSTNAVGQTNDNDNSYMAAKIFDQNGVVVVPEFQVNDEIESGQSVPDLSLLDNGNIFISWQSSDINHSTNAVGQTNDNNSSHMAAKIFDQNGVVVVPEFQVNDEIEGAQSDSFILLLDNGNVIVSWGSGDTNHSINAIGQDNDNSGTYMAAKIFDQNGVVVVPEFQVNDEIEGAQYVPTMSILNNGNIFISWYSSDTNHSTNAAGQTNDNNGTHIAAKIFDQNGVVVVTEFQVNDEIPSNQTYSDPILLNNGNIFISFTSWAPSVNETNFANQDYDNNGSHVAFLIFSPLGERVVHYTISHPYLTPNTPLTFTKQVESFTETPGANNEGTISYQVSTDNGVTWNYWNGTAWTPTVQTDGTETSPATDIDTNIETLDTDGGDFTWRAYLNSNGNQRVELDQIDLSYDTPPPPSTGGQTGVRFICKDPKATNYNPTQFGRHKQSTCKYKEVETSLDTKQCPHFTKYFRFGDKDKEIGKIQTFLQEQGINTGYIDSTMGPITFNAIKEFQKKYFSEILKPWNLSSPTGRWYQSTRHKANQLAGCSEGSLQLDNGVVIN